MWVVMIGGNALCVVLDVCRLDSFSAMFSVVLIWVLAALDVELHSLLDELLASSL